jgi:hypothetical protein
MARRNGEFILLQDGVAKCYASDYQIILDRLNELFSKEPAADYIITQVVGTVDKPKPPVVHSVYGPNI